MTEKRFYTIHKGVYDELKRKELHHGEITSMLNTLHEEKEALELDNKLLLEEMKEIRDKLTIYFKVKGLE